MATFVVTLENYTPTPRADGVPWTGASLQEAPASSGPWTGIDTLALIPIDLDPANPSERTLTSTLATLEQGWYRLIWTTNTGPSSTPTAPVQNTSESEQGIRPMVADVASLLRARTKVPGGKEEGTFTAITRPTADQVSDLIDDAIDEVGGKVQPIDPLGDWNGPGSAYERRYRGAVKLYTAILIELSLEPEQVKSNQSVATFYQQLYDSRIRALISEGETSRPEGMGEGASGSGDSPADACWAFPADTGGLVGWSTRF